MKIAHSILAGAVLAGLAAAAFAAAEPGKPNNIGGPYPLLGGLTTMSWKKTTPAGVALPLFNYFNADARCQSHAVQIIVHARPAHGAVSSARVSAPETFVARNWPAPDKRSKCKSANIVGMQAVYTPAPGFTGVDHFVVDANDNGYVSRHTYDVTVTP